jgi:DNA gyrase/topoisomerase IV subunit B
MPEKADAVPELYGVEAIRKRPGMYVGDVDAAEGLHHLVWEVVGNVVDQHLARAATELHVDVTDDGWVIVSDDSRRAQRTSASVARCSAHASSRA